MHFLYCTYLQGTSTVAMRISEQTMEYFTYNFIVMNSYRKHFNTFTDGGYKYFC